MCIHVFEVERVALCFQNAEDLRVATFRLSAKKEVLLVNTLPPEYYLRLE
jgi:hypothetical protein